MQLYAHCAMFHARHEIYQAVHVFLFWACQTDLPICGPVARYDLTNARPNLDTTTRSLYHPYIRVTGPDTNKSGPNGPIGDE